MNTTPSPAEGLTLRRATDADWDNIIATDARAFVMRNPLPDAERADLRGKVDDSDVVVVYDEAGPPPPRLVGVSMYYRLPMTLPGGDVADTAGLSWVSVAATHRRRGILRRMITELFDQWESEGQVFGILTASEATIYERFGFGPVCFAHDVTVDLSRTSIRQEADAQATVRYGTAEEVAARIPEIHDRWTRTRAGALGRSAAWWKPILADRKSQRPFGSSGLHYLLHQDGYASYRINTATDPRRGDISEIVAVTDAAHTDLWRVLSGLDLLPTVTASIPVDDALPVKLTDRRAAQVTGISDKMWLTILDVPAALGKRKYSGDLDVVLEVTDGFRGRAGVYDLSVRGGGAIVAPSTAEPTVRLDISVLSSIYLGGIDARSFAAADRLWTDSPETLTAFDLAFATDRAPYSGTFF
ncbi:GNAT family N-acetyltransferase [Gordonia soli]|uniref:N-acetyltransferase domain-containing protein n=1 Tax=Gordonia soli NBRC 108243 TaxID=1223545 RepID=M0QLM6_9ACTN|nr:GNAT family N-acetyltransferase [Gordonia soli]GAC68302.1 hypothetical protein GS4_14_01340 [Gordonia soli NBRC 108243]